MYVPNAFDRILFPVLVVALVGYNLFGFEPVYPFVGIMALLLVSLVMVNERLLKILKYRFLYSLFNFDGRTIDPRSTSDVFSYLTWLGRLAMVQVLFVVFSFHLFKELPGKYIQSLIFLDVLSIVLIAGLRTLGLSIRCAFLTNSYLQLDAVGTDTGKTWVSDDQVIPRFILSVYLLMQMTILLIIY